MDIQNIRAFLMVAENKSLESYSNDKLHDYIRDKIDHTVTFCQMQLKEKGISKEITDNFIERHGTRTSLLSAKLDSIIYDDYYYPDNNIKTAVFFSSAILSFDLAISHAEEIDKEIKEKLIA